MNYYEVINMYDKKIDQLDEIKDFVKYLVEKLKLKNTLFNVIIVNDDYILELNSKYRGINKTTDVISFALEDNRTLFNLQIRVLGDIYISYDKALYQSLEYNHSLIRELCFLTVHGLLHLLGYDHMNKEDEKIMFNLQMELLDNYGIKK